MTTIQENFSAEATWLAEEMKSIAIEAGISPENADTLWEIVRKLAQSVCAGKNTAMRISRGDCDFLKSLVGTPILGTDEKAHTPLVVDFSCVPAKPTLYFRRQFMEEINIARAITTLAKMADDTSAIESKVCNKIICSGPDDGFPFALSNEQIDAVQKILTKKLVIVSGGPGTGKTSLLLRAVLCMFEMNAETKIEIVAPTGKAAMRIMESIKKQLSEITCPNIHRKSAESISAKTIHRLLGITDTPKKPKTPDADVVIIDEASMISQELTAILMQALNPSTKLILLGDENQLESVDAGHVFGDLCAAVGLSKNRVNLKESMRFGSKEFIGRLANAVIRGDDKSVFAELSACRDKRFECVPYTGKVPARKLARIFLQVFPDILMTPPDSPEPQKMLEAIENCRIISPERRGNIGTENLNSIGRKIVSKSATGSHFHGEPIMILKNDYTQKLFNGDIGVVLRDSAGTMSAWFRDPENAGELRKISVDLLPENETAYAMTVHKSQGSEFSKLAVFIPEEKSEILSRQLLYTALTRFKEAPNCHLTFFYSEENLRLCLSKKNSAGTNLAERI